MPSGRTPLLATYWVNQTRTNWTAPTPMKPGLAARTSGPWREWDATIADGTEMQFDPDSLAACGDPVVVQLVLAADALDELLED